MHDNPIARRGREAYERLRADPELLAKLARRGLPPDRADWLLARCADVFAEFEAFAEPPAARRERLGRWARRLRTLALDLAADPDLAEITVDDPLPRQAALSEEDLAELAGRNLRAYDPAPRGYVTLAFRRYLEGLAAVLEEDPAGWGLEATFEALGPPSGRATQARPFALRWIGDLLAQALPSRSGHGRNTLAARIASIVLEEEVTPNDVTQARRAARRRYWTE